MPTRPSYVRRKFREQGERSGLPLELLCLQVTITRINSGDISAEVVGMLDDGTSLCALITDGSVRELSLARGDRV